MDHTAPRIHKEPTIHHNHHRQHYHHDGDIITMFCNFQYGTYQATKTDEFSSKFQTAPQWIETCEIRTHQPAFISTLELHQNLIWSPYYGPAEQEQLPGVLLCCA